LSLSSMPSTSSGAAHAVFATFVADAGTVTPTSLRELAGTAVLVLTTV
jgi:hypothetical protein